MKSVSWKLLVLLLVSVTAFAATKIDKNSTPRQIEQRMMEIRNEQKNAPLDEQVKLEQEFKQLQKQLLEARTKAGQ